MLLSMTGHGQARVIAESVSVGAEIRAVNNRFLKVTVNMLDRMADLESKIKGLVQNKIRRGSVHIQLEIQKRETTDRFRIDTDVLQSYRDQLQPFHDQIEIESLLGLPGVVTDHTPLIDSDSQVDETWPHVQQALEQALDRLIEMRTHEGASMASDLLANCQQIASHLEQIETHAPQVIRNYSKRLTERMNQMLGEYEVSVETSDVVREVGIFADKCDISEEIVRLKTHIEQFSSIVKSSQGDGRKLEFLTQEMLRETNTIGSKANDATIAQHVVEIKTAIERIREMTQNIE